MHFEHSIKLQTSLMLSFTFELFIEILFRYVNLPSFPKRVSKFAHKKFYRIG
jgi:hypothetical protein